MPSSFIMRRRCCWPGRRRHCYLVITPPRCCWRRRGPATHSSRASRLRAATQAGQSLSEPSPSPRPRPSPDPHPHPHQAGRTPRASTGGSAVARRRSPHCARCGRAQRVSRGSASARRQRSRVASSTSTGRASSNEYSHRVVGIATPRQGAPAASLASSVHAASPTAAATAAGHARPRGAPPTDVWWPAIREARRRPAVSRRPLLRESGRS